MGLEKKYIAALEFGRGEKDEIQGTKKY